MLETLRDERFLLYLLFMIGLISVMYDVAYMIIYAFCTSHFGSKLMNFIYGPSSIGKLKRRLEIVNEKNKERLDK